MPIPPLSVLSALGVATNVKAAADQISVHVPVLHEFSSLDQSNTFASLEAALVIDNCKIISVSHTPIYLDRLDPKGFQLWLPFLGRLNQFIGKNKIEIIPNQSGFLTLPERRVMRAETGSAVAFEFDPSRLRNFANHMSGASLKSKIDFEERRLIRLDNFKFSFHDIFLSLFRTIDSCKNNIGALKILGVEDSIYRMLTTLIIPEILKVPISRDIPPKQIRLLCDFMDAHLDQAITLTKLEELSGLSARSIQYAFQKYFGMRPKQWLNLRRLEKARAVLKIDPKTNITQLSYSLGFSHPSQFSLLYKREFGVSPSNRQKV